MKGGKAPPVIHHPGRKAGVQTRQRVWFPSGRARKRRVKAALNLVLTWPLTWLLWDPASPLPGEDCDWGMVCPWLFPYRGCRRTRGCPSWPPLFLTLMDTGQTTPGWRSNISIPPNRISTSSSLLLQPGIRADIKLQGWLRGSRGYFILPNFSPTCERSEAAKKWCLRCSSPFLWWAGGLNPSLN